MFVTNKKDKEVQLVKLNQLEEVKSILVNLKWYDIHEDGMVVRDDGNAINFRSVNLIARSCCAPESRI